MTDLNLFNQPPVFHGSDYDEEHDCMRLTGQRLKIFLLMEDGVWRTLREIEDLINEPQASISAQLRHLRNDKSGNFEVDKRRRGEPKSGCWEYKLTYNNSSNGFTP